MLSRSWCYFPLLCVMAAPSWAAAPAEAPATRPGNGLARPEDQAFQQRLFGRVLLKSPIHACFDRAYDAGHLAAHPSQKVRTMRLLVTGQNAGSDGGPTYDLAMRVTFRKNGTHFEASGFCGSIHDQMSPGEGGKVAHCGVACDGGVINVSLKDQSSVLVAIPNGASTSSPQGENDGPRFGSDDKVFRLQRTALTNCSGLVEDADTRRAIRRGE